LVDGKPYNVKVTDSPRYIQEHLDSHPDIDVITNREMAAAFGDDPRVLIDDNLSVQDAFHLTSDTLEAVGDMGGVLDQVPYLALAINAVKQGRRLYKGEVDWKTAGEHMAVDTAATGIGGLMGGNAGLALGLALAPVTGGASVVVVPAAALLGSLAGVFTSKLGGNWIKARHLRAAESRLDVAASLLAETFLRLKADVRSRVSAYFDTRITEARSGSAGAGTGMRKRLFPTVEKVFYEMAEEEFCREKKADLDSLSALEREVSALPSKAAGRVLVQKDPAIFMGVDPLPSLHADAVELVKDVAEEKRKLG